MSDLAINPIRLNTEESRLNAFLTTRWFYYDVFEEEYRLRGLVVKICDWELTTTDKVSKEVKSFETTIELEDFINDYLNKLKECLN